MSKTVLSLDKVVRVYTQGERELRVLDGLNLKVHAGEMVGLVGPSGSGKSTLLQIAGLLDTPTGGAVHVGDQEMTRADDVVRTKMRSRHIGFVYQFHHLLPEFSAMENVVIPQMIAGMRKSNAEAHGELLLSDLGLGARLNHRPAALSGGEQQRVAIARALANNPTLLLADEPTGNLDPETAEHVFTLLLRTVREKRVAMLVATHNHELAMRMDRVVRLEHGRL
ncbi:MAG: ABC transporter ATP-binding protein [Rickettsiales bacterium]|nr:ABC transporter ATP-binding protein [Rickettsiales bacterium]